MTEGDRPELQPPWTDADPDSRTIDLAAYGLVNVGKSSLINALARREAVATSPIGGTTTGIVGIFLIVSRYLFLR